MPTTRQTTSKRTPKRAAAQAHPRKISEAQALQHLRELLAYLGDDPTREGLLETPRRIVKSWDKLFGGYRQKPQDVLKTFVEGSCEEMVVLKDIEFYSVRTPLATLLWHH